MKYSIATFGSSNRKDFDKYSDKDLLIVGDSYSTMKSIVKEYEERDFSVSFYTYDKLIYLSENKSLFVQHLKQESKILEDNDDFLRNIFFNYHPKKNYNKEQSEARNFLTHIKTIIDNPISRGWFCDVAFLAIRNFMIFSSANKKKYTFSYSQLITEHKIGFTRTEIITLNELRVVKKNYRDKIISELPSSKYIKDLINILKKLNLIDSIELAKIEQNEYIKQNIGILDSKFLTSYQRIRFFELLYRNSKIKSDIIETMIMNPQNYTSQFTDDKYKKHVKSIKNTARNTMYDSISTPSS